MKHKKSDVALANKIHPENKFAESFYTDEAGVKRRLIICVLYIGTD